MPELKPNEATILAAKRTLLAAERTLMAWIRTAFSMISFGFTVFKFFQYLRKDEMAPSATGHGPRNLGIALILLGTTALVVAIWQHRGTMLELTKVDSTPAPRSLATIVAVAVIVLGALAFLSVAVHIGPF